MSNLLIIMTVAYIVAIIMQIGYCLAWYKNDISCHNLSAVIIFIISIIFAPIMILLEIGAALLFAGMVK